MSNLTKPMLRRNQWVACSRLCAMTVLLGAASIAHAQALASGQTSTTLNAGVLGQLDTDLDSGGSFNWTSASLGLKVAHQFSGAVSSSVSVGYVSEDWSFDAPTAFGGKAPWGRIQRPSLGFNFGYKSAKDLTWFVAPQLQWAYEDGASASDGLNYGAVFGATKTFSPDLVVGFGLGVFRQIDDTKYFPFVVVNWQINDKLRLTNPLPAGPAGGAGLELVYAWNNEWELGGGAAYRDYRFRLSEDGAVPGGIGRNTGAPIFVRLTRKFGPSARVDLHAGTVIDGRLRVMDAGGATVQSSDYGTAPLLGLTGSINF